MDSIQDTIWQKSCTLFKNRSIDDISIDEIVRISFVSRSTFYRMFNNKYSVIEYGITRTLNQFLSNSWHCTCQDSKNQAPLCNFPTMSRCCQLISDHALFHLLSWVHEHKEMIFHIMHCSKSGYFRQVAICHLLHASSSQFLLSTRYSQHEMLVSTYEVYYAAALDLIVIWAEKEDCSYEELHNALRLMNPATFSCS